MNRYRVRHRTTYRYSDPVLSSHHSTHVIPRDCPRQRVNSSTMAITPTPEHIHRYRDFADNVVCDFNIVSSYQECSVQVDSVVEVEPAPNIFPPDKAALQSWQDWQAHCRNLDWDQRQHIADYVRPSPATPWEPSVITWSKSTFTPNRPLTEAVLELNQRIFQEFTYQPGVTDIDTPLATVMVQRQGVCQDFAHLMVAALRAHGIPTRYVSGYLETFPAPGQERLVGADASHAWVSAWLPVLGWVDFDPTNSLVVGERHITTAWGRDYHDVTPLKGIVVGGGVHSVEVAVDVESA
ncbi:MAG: transglutaminase family protein [Planctomycetota bacterium]|nr:MAG: transglutaminase family protein [Planctomycetota bacterium]